MAAQALYRRWRPQSFDDVIGQEHITVTLRHALATDRLAHAYLFTGPRGTGKTSVARILAKAVNCTGEGDKPCNACALCQAITEARSLDLVEIDAASNTGVDDVRDLREKIGFAPNEATYKVYIVDEVHMLSTAAFNALLKTLEEPPPHVLFVLATTEPHKIPDTILSRCQRHDFRRVGVTTLVGKLERICRVEGFDVEPAALEAVARSATGSIRDAESLLDQLVAAGDRVTADLVGEVLGTTADDTLSGLVDALVTGDAAPGLRLINEALDRGADPRQLQRQLLDYLRGLLLIQTGVAEDLLGAGAEAVERMRAQAAALPTEALVATIHRFNDAQPSPDRNQPALPLELALVESVLDRGTGDAPAVGTGSAALEPTPNPHPASPAASEPESQSAPAPRAPLGKGRGALTDLIERWPEVMETVDARDKNLAALLKDCRPVSIDENAVTLGFFYPFHCQRVSAPERSAVVRGGLEAVLGRPVDLRCTVVAQTDEEQAARPRTKADQARTDPVIRHAIDELGARIAGVEVPPDEETKTES